MRLAVYHRLNDACQAQLRKERLQRLAQGEVIPEAAAIAVTVFAPPLPVDVLEHATIDRDGSRATLNLTGMPHPDADQGGVGRCPARIRLGKVYEPGVTMDGYAHRIYGIEIEPKIAETRAYGVYQAGEYAVLESAAVAATMEEVTAALAGCVLQDWQREHNQKQEQDRHLFRNFVSQEKYRLEQLIEQARQEEHERLQARIARRADGLTELRGWGRAHGSDLLKYRLTHGFDWQELAEAEWAWQSVSMLWKSGWQAAPPLGPNCQVEMYTIPDLEQAREFAQFKLRLDSGQADEPEEGFVIWEATTLVRVTDLDQGGHGAGESLQLQVTVRLPTGEPHSLRFVMKSAAGRDQ